VRHALVVGHGHHAPAKVAQTRMLRVPPMSTLRERI
jgi:hypothetical protein